MIPGETYINKSTDNRKDDLKFTPFTSALSLNPPNILNYNSNSTNYSNISKSDSLDEDIPTLFSYDNVNNSNTTFQCPSDFIRNLDFDFNDDADLIRDCTDNHLDDVFKSIEKNAPGILTLMAAYNIPYPIAKLIGRKFIRLTLDYCKRSW